MASDLRRPHAIELQQLERRPLDKGLPAQTEPPLSQHSDEEWEALRPVITDLYLRKARPLERVMEDMIRHHRFKASKSMYKKRFARWNLQKNRPRHSPIAGNAARHHDSTVDETELSGQSSSAGLVVHARQVVVGSPRILRQNDQDEAMQVLLDCMDPYVRNAFAISQLNPDPLMLASDKNYKYRWTVGGSTYESPAFKYLYNDFSLGIVDAVTAFSSADHAAGGSAVRASFLALEDLMAERHPFVLPMLFYALVCAASSGYIDVATILLRHAYRLASATLPWRHPLVCILRQFADGSNSGGGGSGGGPASKQPATAPPLAADECLLLHAVLTGWRACHALMNADETDARRLFLYRKCFWQDPRQAARRDTVEHSLRRLLSVAEMRFGRDHDIPIVVLDELVALYAQFGRDGPELEAACLDALGRIRRRVEARGGGAEDVSGEFAQWQRNLSLELAWYYHRKGETKGLMGDQGVGGWRRDG